MLVRREGEISSIDDNLRELVERLCIIQRTSSEEGYPENQRTSVHDDHLQ